MRVRGAMLAVAGVLLLSGAPAAAEPEPVFDTEQVIDQLERDRIVRLPGAVATLDDSRVLAALPPNGRVLLAPPINALPDAPIWRHTLGTVRKWADRSGRQLTVVRGLWVERDGRHPEYNYREGQPFTTADEPTLRRWLAYGDVTAPVLRETSPGPPLVPATAEQLDRLPVTPVRPGVRLAILPQLAADAPFVDYAAGLAQRFPGDLVIVGYGRWLEIAGESADRAEYLRNVAYGSFFVDRRPVADVVTAVVDQLAEPPARPVFGTAPPSPPDLLGNSRVVAAAAIHRRLRGLARRPARAAAAAEPGERGEVAVRDGGRAGDHRGPRRPAARHRAGRPPRGRTPRHRTRPVRPGPHSRGDGRGACRRRRGTGTGRRRPLMRHRWIPFAFAAFALVSVSGMLGAFDGPAPYGSVADELRYTAVHTDPDAEGLIDVPRVHRLIGDRPIVVAAVTDTDTASVACAFMIDEFPGLIGLVVSTDDSFSSCENANPHYELSFQIQAEHAAAFLGSRTDLVAEYVRIYDAHVAATAPDQPPPRRAAPPPPDSGPDRRQVTRFVILGIVFGGIALFAAYVVRELWSGIRWQAGRTRRWRAETDARLNRLADVVLRTDQPRSKKDAGRRADVAKRYVLTLREFEATKSPGPELERMLTELEEAIGLSEPEPAPEPEPEQRPARRRRGGRKKRRRNRRR